MRKLCLFLILLSLITSALSSVSFSAKPGLGLRKTTASDGIFTFWGDISLGSATFSFMETPFELTDISASYRYFCNRTFYINGSAFSRIISPDFKYNGGYSSLTFTFGQDFKWKYASFFYEFGCQASMAYSPYSSLLTYAFSPVLVVKGGAGYERVFAYLFAGVGIKEEAEYKTLPAFGFELEGIINDRFSVDFKLWAKGAEILTDDWFTFTGYGFNFGVTYKDNL